MGGGMCVLSVQDNREAITAHILQGRNLRCHRNAPREKKETCHTVALLERCSRTHTHGRWHARTKGVVLGFLRTTGVNGSPPTEGKEESPPHHHKYCHPCTIKLSGASNPHIENLKVRKTHTYSTVYSSAG